MNLNFQIFQTHPSQGKKHIIPGKIAHPPWDDFSEPGFSPKQGGRTQPKVANLGRSGPDLSIDASFGVSTLPLVEKVSLGFVREVSECGTLGVLHGDIHVLLLMYLI